MIYKRDFVLLYLVTIVSSYTKRELCYYVIVKLGTTKLASGMTSMIISVTLSGAIIK